ncbi:MAG: hypothetical protein J6Y93_03290, partial [Treponema sp.]|nr:hypothetical protein [Treponema sp.]
SSSIFCCCLSEKSAAIRESSGTDNGELALIALDFINTNRPLIGNDRDLNSLAVSTVFALPKEKFTDSKKNEAVTDKLITTFSVFDDENVKISVLEKLPLFYSYETSSKTVSVINSSLTSEQNRQSQAVKAHITALGKIGNSESFRLLYEGWKTNRWPSFKTETEEALVMLGESSPADVVKVISTSQIDDNYKFLRLIVENQTIHKNFKSEVAENALSQAIHNRDIKAQMSENEADYQLLSLKIISDNQWSRASEMVIRYFAIARQEYENKILTETQFITVINCTARIGSADSAAALSNYLAALNKDVEQNIVPQRNVVLSVINNLGALGDKTSFDNLLYVTYLNYPEEVIAASRDALSKLKW